MYIAFYYWGNWQTRNGLLLLYHNYIIFRVKYCDQPCQKLFVNQDIYQAHIHCWQLAHIDEYSVPQANCVRKERSTVGISPYLCCTGSAILHVLCFKSFGARRYWLQLAGIQQQPAGIATRSCRMRYSIRTLLQAKIMFTTSHKDNIAPLVLYHVWFTISHSLNSALLSLNGKVLTYSLAAVVDSGRSRPVSFWCRHNCCLL